MTLWPARSESEAHPLRRISSETDDQDDSTPPPAPPTAGTTNSINQKCWVCNGKGVTTSGAWLDEADQLGGKLTPDGSEPCPVCFESPGKYGVSVECHHLFCVQGIHGGEVEAFAEPTEPALRSLGELSKRSLPHGAVYPADTTARVVDARDVPEAHVSWRLIRCRVGLVCATSDCYWRYRADPRYGWREVLAAIHLKMYCQLL